MREEEGISEKIGGITLEKKTRKGILKEDTIGKMG